MTSLPHILPMRRCMTCKLSKRDIVKGHVVTAAETVTCHGSTWITTSREVKLALPVKRLLDIPLPSCIFTEPQTSISVNHNNNFTLTYSRDLIIRDSTVTYCKLWNDSTSATHSSELNLCGQYDSASEVLAARLQLCFESLDC